MSVIACVDLDPFLVGLVQRVRAGDVVVEVPARELLAGRPGRYAAVVMSAGSPAASDMAGAAIAERTILVASRRDGAAPPSHPGPVLRRPVDAAELRVALARLVPPGRLRRLAARLRAMTGSAQVDRAFVVARAAAVAGAAALVLTEPVSDPVRGVVGALVGWTLFRVLVQPSTAALVGLDVLLTVASMVVTGGPDSPFLLLAIVVAAEVGYTYSRLTGALVIGSGTVAGLVPLSMQLARGEAAPTELVAWAALIPMASSVGIFAARIRRDGEGGSLRRLIELHGTLDLLAKQAQGAAGSLDLSSVAENVLTVLRRDLHAEAGILVVGDGQVHDVLATMGLSDAAPARVVMPGGRTSRLPDELESLLPEGDLLTAPLRAVGIDRGMIVAVLPTGQGNRDADILLGNLAAETAVAIDNARLFEGIRELTVDGERRRLARELHDGVIQSLVHVRFELDLVRRMIDDPHADEVARLREVVGQAVEEVRATVNDLRSVRLSSGLGAALLSVGREYERPGLRVVVDADPVETLTPEAELQLLRIAQEAISNAVHHGKASVVYVRMWEDDAHVSLQVLDDGMGMDHSPAVVGRGVGLRAMHERAELMGAVLHLGPGEEGGTSVHVEVPLERTNT
jgi:signal transduction histidine kinase